MPGLSVVTVICLSILISLGTWQYHRLQWKTALLAEVEAAVTAPPLTSLRELSHLIKNDAAVDFRRIKLSAEIDKTARSYFVYKPRQDGIYWQVFTPITESGISLFAGLGVVRDADKDTYDKTSLAEGLTSLAGYVRKDHPMGRIESWVKSAATPDDNRYFKFNQTGDWDSGGKIQTEIYLDITPGADLNSLPPKRPEIRNNHFDYMLTWYSFAIILLIIYFLLHFRQGRLRFK